MRQYAKNSPNREGNINSNMGANMEALILSLEASGESVSVALWKEGGVRACAVHKARFGHAETLIGLTEQIMTETGCKFDELTHIAAGCGPGSFTGVRIAIAAAKGYVLATCAQGIGVNGLVALNYHAYLRNEKHEKNDLYLACADTRRKSVFVQMSDHKGMAMGDVREMDEEAVRILLHNKVTREHKKPIISGWENHDYQSSEGEFSGVELSAETIALYAGGELVPEMRYGEGSRKLEAIYVTEPKIGARNEDMK